MRNIPKTKGNIHINSTIVGYRGFELIQYNQVIFKPLDNDDLVYFLQNIEKYKKKIKITPIGILPINRIKELPISGAIIVFENVFNGIKLENNILEVGCGARNSEISNFARKNGISDLKGCTKAFKIHRVFKEQNSTTIIHSHYMNQRGGRRTFFYGKAVQLD